MKCQILVKSILLIIIVLSLSCAPATETFYYVDSISGNDTNKGTSPEYPWKSLEKVNTITFTPGDYLLFKCNSIWSGQLWPKGSGKKGKLIIIDNYGTGNLPIINGNGEVENTVYLFNQEYWEISNLEITNYKDGDQGLKRGVWIVAKDFGTLQHIHLKNLYVHDVNGSMQTRHNGGICFEVLGHKTKTNFDDFLIEGCRVLNCNRSGITNQSTWRHRTIDNESLWYPSTNVIIRNNWIERSGGNGLVVRVSDHPLIEHNVFKENSIIGTGNAVYPFNCNDALIQYNESYMTVYNPGDVDAGGFDSDWDCKRSVFQYNYSHDNDYGFMLICNWGKYGFNNGTVIRYNISQNDNGFIFRTAGPATNTKIYNNTIYIKPDMQNARMDSVDNGIPKICYFKDWDGYSDGVYFYNNIFYNLSKRTYYDFGNSKNNVFEYNVFYGEHPESEPDDPYKITDDPMFMNSGSGSIGINTLAGYVLKNGSPCLNSGMMISDNGGMDYWGNPVYNGLPDRGAHEKQN
jgi:hypothetical protein